MKFCVRYRAKDGRLTSMTMEAENRNGVFDELSRRGISAVSVSEGEAKPAKSLAQRRGGAGSGTRLAVYALAVVCAVAGGTWYFARKETLRSGDSEARRGRQIATHKPSSPGDKGGQDAAETPGAAAAVESLAATGAPTNDVVSAEPPKPKKKFRIIRKDEGKKKLFHNIADIYISRVVNSQPGNLVVGTINYDRFPEQFKKALETPITIDEDDTPGEVAKKQAVIETRAELKKMLDEGVDISEVMREAEAESRRLWNYRRSLHLELAKAMKDGKFNADDMQDYVDAANMMLKDNGMEPLKYPQFWVRRMRQQEAEAAAGK